MRNTGKYSTRSEIIPPQYISSEAVIERSIIGEGTEVYGEVHNSVIGAGVTIGKGAVIRDSIIMQNSRIEEGAVINKAIIAEDVCVGKNAELGAGEYVPSKYDPKVYQFDLVTVGERFCHSGRSKDWQKYRDFRRYRAGGVS